MNSAAQQNEPLYAEDIALAMEMRTFGCSMTEIRWRTRVTEADLVLAESIGLQAYPKRGGSEILREEILAT